MTKQESATLISALAKAQSQMKNAVFNRVNPHFKNEYADLAAIREATIPALSANGLAIVQYTNVDGEGRLLLHTRLAHKNGEYIEGTYPLPMALDKPQIMGSALTYAKRYSWAAICGVCSDDDDDANSAHANGKTNGNGKASYITDEQWKILSALITETGSDVDRFLRHFHIEALVDLPSTKFQTARELLEAKRK